MEQADLNKIIKEIGEMGMRNWLIKTFTVAFREARKGKLKTFNEHAYDERWTENIPKLVDTIIERYYKPSGSISFIVHEPMMREIFAAPFVDRIVHHFLYELQAGWWDKRLIDTSYSCREGKGTLYAVQKTQQQMRQVSHNFTMPAYYIKLDIQGYFMSLPRERLYKRIQWGLTQQFRPYFHSSEAYQLYLVCNFLWRQVLMDDPVSKSRRRGLIRDWKILPAEKSLYAQPEGQGIVIGNLTSQMASNIYLDQLDRFVKYDLGYRYYGRYVDDFIMLVTEAQYNQAKKDVKIIEKYLKDELLLTLHPKKRQYQSIYKGVPFVGARIYPHCIFPSNRLQQKFNHTLHAIRYGEEIKNETIMSYLGFLKNCDASKYVKRMFEKYGLDYSLYLELMKPKEERRSWDEIIDELKRRGRMKKRGLSRSIARPDGRSRGRGWRP